MGKRMKSLDPTPAEAAILGALLWRFRFTLARMTGQRERVRQMLAEDEPEIPRELREAVDVAVGGMDDDIPEVPASTRREFTEKTHVLIRFCRSCAMKAELKRVLRN